MEKNLDEQITEINDKIGLLKSEVSLLENKRRLLLIEKHGKDCSNCSHGHERASCIMEDECISENDDGDYEYKHWS